jgi:hypothetical protein
MVEQRQTPFVIEEAKFSTQRVVTYVLLAIFAGVTAAVFFQNDQSERSTVLQTIINLTFLASGYWLGASKGAADMTAKMMPRRADPPVPEEEKKP